MSLSASEEQPFQIVYNALWKKPLDSIIQNAHDDDSGTVFQYIPSAVLAKLKLEEMNYKEEVLLIRGEYVTAFDTLEHWSGTPQGGGGVAVMGSPDIGKSVFLFYLLFCRLSAGLPTALQVFDDRFFLFTDTGTSEHNPQSKNAEVLPAGTWALTDSGEFIGQPCGAFLAAPRKRCWIIQATSLKQSRWYEWCKQRVGRKYVMDGFPPDELKVLGRLLNLDVDQLLSHYWTWGPSVRVCVRLTRGSLTVEELTSSASTAAASFAKDPGKVFRLITEFNLDELSHVLFAVQPSAESRAVARAQIPTNHLWGIVTLAVARLDVAQQLAFFTQISSHPWTRGSAGWIFEKFVHI